MDHLLQGATRHMRLLPTSQAAPFVHVHRNTLQQWRKVGLLKGGVHWFRKGPYGNSSYLWDVDAISEVQRGWLTDQPESLSLLNCSKLHKAEQDL